MKRRQILDLSKSRFNPLTICLTVKEFWRGSLMIKEVNIFRSLLNRETNNMKTPWLGLDKCSKIRQRTALHSLGYGLHCKCFTPIANLREFFNEWQQLVSFQMVCQRHVEMSLTFTCEWLLCKVAVQAQACTSKMAEQLQWYEHCGLPGATHLDLERDPPSADVLPFLLTKAILERFENKINLSGLSSIPFETIKYGELLKHSTLTGNFLKNQLWRIFHKRGDNISLFKSTSDKRRKTKFELGKIEISWSVSWYLFTFLPNSPGWEEKSWLKQPLFQAFVGLFPYNFWTEYDAGKRVQNRK